ncbi:hypothetical protein [Hymenobacter sp. APR13]|uniref:hypothetical protein n=1 Tax=Hymenobacter sp. APR13 TaxID=1356852 RepID=UPI0004E09505|nr:hypothetical protein [Hymenobacter sp. APR13]AII51300.1 hypothetical protein N008_04795 [Hymenobacter sp. APR13]
MRITIEKVLSAISLLTTVACTKEVERVVVQEKAYSWAEVKQLAGSQKNIVQITQDEASLYLQQLGYLGRLMPLPGATQPNRPGYYSAVRQPLQPLPYDLTNRIPMNGRFYLKPVGEDNMTLRAFPTTHIPPDNLPADISLRRLDPTAVRFVNNRASPYFALGAITTNNISLVGYSVAPSDQALHFVLSRLSLESGVPTGPVTVSSRTLTIPLPQALPYTIVAVDDYFLVNVISYGLYKISESGQVQQVLTLPNTAITSFYKHKGVLYAINNSGQRGVFTSSDDAQTWQLRTGIPDYFVLSTFHAVGDSIVGITHGIDNNSLYTLRWQGNTPRVRELKNDGLNQADFTDLAQLGDTVYLSTTSGLFKRPLSAFFENR